MSNKLIIFKQKFNNILTDLWLSCCLCVTLDQEKKIFWHWFKTASSPAKKGMKKAPISPIKSLIYIYL